MRLRKGILRVQSAGKCTAASGDSKADGKADPTGKSCMEGEKKGVRTGGDTLWDHDRDHTFVEGSSMGIAIIFKIAAVGIIVTVLSQVLKHSGREEHAFLLSLAGLISELFDTMETMFSL